MPQGDFARAQYRLAPFDGRRGGECAGAGDGAHSQAGPLGGEDRCIHPGRGVWSHGPGAVDWNGTDFCGKPENFDAERVLTMAREASLALQPRHRHGSPPPFGQSSSSHALPRHALPRGNRCRTPLNVSNPGHCEHRTVA